MQTGPFLRSINLYPYSIHAYKYNFILSFFQILILYLYPYFLSNPYNNIRQTGPFYGLQLLNALLYLPKIDCRLVTLQRMTVIKAKIGWCLIPYGRATHTRFWIFYRIYFLYAFDFHLPCAFISSTEYPSLCIEVAPPILNECDLIYISDKSQNFNACFNTALNWYEVSGLPSKWQNKCSCLWYLYSRYCLMWLKKALLLSLIFTEIE